MGRTRTIALAGFCVLGALILGVLLFSRVDPVTLGGARAVAVPGSPEGAHVYLRIGNGDAPDQLLGASSAEAEKAVLVGARGNGSLPIPANGAAVLSSDGVHLLLTGVDGILEEGRLIPVALEFERSGLVTTRAEVGPSGDPHSGHAAPAPETGGADPSLEMRVVRGDEGGWSVRLETRNFVFDSETEMPVHVPGHGHGHLYVNGLKIGRMYSENATIGALPPGTYEIRAVLNTNEHAPYLTGSGEPAAASAVISVD